MWVAGHSGCPLAPQCLQGIHSVPGAPPMAHRRVGETLGLSCPSPMLRALQPFLALLTPEACPPLLPALPMQSSPTSSQWITFHPIPIPPPPASGSMDPTRGNASQSVSNWVCLPGASQEPPNCSEV